jgi:glutathione S-transferase
MSGDHWQFDYRIQEAELRDERDAERLAACQDICTRGLDALIPLMGRLEHPFARWRPDDLAQALSEQLENIKHELARINAPVLVLDDE